MSKAEALLLRNGLFYTSPRDLIGGDLLIEDGSIVAFGSHLQRPKGLLSCDLERCLVLPGFIDSHLHLEKVAGDLEKVCLSDATCLADVLTALEAHTTEVPTNGWIQVYDEDCAWSEASLREGRLPSVSELDLALPNYPVFVSCGRRCVLNTLGMRKLCATDLDPNSKAALSSLGDRSLEVIEGEGLIKAIKQMIPTPGFEARKAAVIRAMHALNRVGITGVVDPGRSDVSFEESWQLYTEIAAEEKATVRVSLMARFPAQDQIRRALTFLRSRPIQPVDRWFNESQWLRFGGVKLIADGEIETGWFRAPLRFPYDRGTIKHFDTEELFSVVWEAARHRCPLGIHALGGGASDMALGVLSEVDQEIPILPIRFSLIHAFFPDASTYERCRKMGIIASLQQPLVYAYAPQMVDAWRIDKAQQVNPVGVWLHQGITVAAGSDVLLFDPRLGLWSMVTRTTRLGTLLGRSSALSIAEAVSSYTCGGAYLTHSEGERGTIAPGFLADLTIFSENIFQVPSDSIPSIGIKAVLVGGRCVYSDGELNVLQDL